MTGGSVTLGPRFTQALTYAAELHADQLRKGTHIPYVSHLLSVVALVLEDGGDEDEAIAALLHDAVEDQGGRRTLDAIRALFGSPVADIVEDCSDSETLPKPPWRPRKELYLHRLQRAPVSVLRVSAADKLHNLRCIVLDYRERGDGLWARFNTGADDIVWYYRSVIGVLRERLRSPLVCELELSLEQLEQLRRGTPQSSASTGHGGQSSTLS